MANVLSAKDIADLVVGTLDELGRLKFQQIAQGLQDYEVMGRWLKADRVIQEDGIGIRRTIMNQTAGAASHVGMFHTDNVNVSDHLVTITVPWRHAQTNWAFEHREVLMNRGRSLITNIIKPRRVGAMIDMADLLEEAAWTAPDDTDQEPYGLPYWVVDGGSNTGFTGDTPANHSTVGGLTPTDSNGWKNYSAEYTNVTKADLIKKMRTGLRKIGFKSPVDVNDYRNGRGDRYRIYCGESVFSAFEDIGESQNENLGKDIASVDGTSLTFRKHPLRWVPQLDDSSVASDDPIFMIDHSVFHPVVLKGDVLRESAPEKSPNSHNTFQVFVDLTYNYICVDRRRCARFQTA